jgi:AcrR family transcriptional regulator
MPRINAEYHSDAKRKIITATLDIARESGWNTVTLEAVARRVGVTKAALYTYFENSSSLNEEATFELIRKLWGRILADTEKENVGIRESVEHIAEILFTRVDPIAPLFLQALSAIIRNKQFREQVYRQYDEVLLTLSEKLLQRQRSGEISPKVDVYGSLRAINGLTLGLAFIYILSEEDPQEARVIWIDSVGRILQLQHYSSDEYGSRNNTLSPKGVTKNGLRLL